MSLNIGELVGFIRLDHSGVGDGIRAAERDMRTGMDRLQNDAKLQGTRVGSAAGAGMSQAFKAGVSSLAKVAVGAFAVERVVSGLRAAKDAASRFNETSSMSAVIFGRNTDAMKAWAQQGPRSLGLSTEASLRAAAGYADMFLQLGFAEGKAMDMSRATVQLAADLGSFRNLETGDVLERLSAGFRGEYDSLQLLIPNISAARVEQEALIETGKATAAALTVQEKAAATLAIVQKDGARASGDYARTRDGEANASKTAAAMTEDLAAKLGQVLLPAYTTMVTFGRDEVIPFLSEAVDWFETGAKTAKPLADGVSSVASAFKGMPEPVQAATLGIIAMVALRGRVEAFGTAIQTRVASGATAGAKALDGLRLSIMYASEEASSRAGRFAAVGKAIGTTAASGIRGAASGLVGFLGGPWGIAFAGAVTVLGAWMAKQKEARERVKALTDTLDKQTGAVTKNTREMVRNELEQAGALEAAARAGLNLQDVFDAALGDPAAADRMNAAMKRLLETTTQYQYQGSTIQGAPALQALRGDLATVNGAIGDQSSALREASSEEARKNKIDIEGSSSQQQYGDAADTTTGQLKDQRDVLKDLAKLTLELSGAQVDSIKAESDYEAAVDAANKALQENGRTVKKGTHELDLGTEAGRANAAALTELRDNAVSLIESQAKQGESTASLNKTMDGARDRFVAVAAKMLGSKAAAEQMADKLGLTRQTVDDLKLATDKLPTAKEIKVQVEAEEAKRELEALRRQLAGLQSKGIVVTATGRYVTEQSTSGGRNLGGGSTMADGGILRFADGAEDHRAFIARPGNHVRVWAEPETGGEAYIPLAAGKRGRSTGVLGQVADEFGYDLVRQGRSAAGPGGSMSVVHNHYNNIGQVRPNDYGDLMDQLAAAEQASLIAGGLR